MPRNKAESIDKKQYPKFRKLLEDRKNTLLQHIENVGAELSYLDQSRPPELSEEAQEEAAAISLKALDERERHELEDIIMAIEKLNDKTYGTCDSCGESIGLVRINFLPSVRYCISCQTTLEERGKHKGSF
ncbi:MAG: TraR/DksA family transcriptional regulator [Acidobacteriota bacterium]